MHVHYHPATTCEPLTFTDKSFLHLFGWSPGLEKIYTGQNSYSADLPPDESFALCEQF